MSFPKFRFTLNNSIAGSLQISEPAGWDEAVLRLERNKEFHSLVEFYDQPLTFYGQSSEGNGGLDYIREIEKGQGPDAQITILIEISNDEGDTYTTAFDGLIDITSCKEIDFYKAEYGIIRNDFWQKFINRKGTPVNLAATTDLDGNAITVVSSFTLSLPSQKLRQRFERLIDYSTDGSDFTSSTKTVTGTDFILFNNEPTDIDEVAERFEYGTQISDDLPTDVFKYYFLIEKAGAYRIEASIRYKFVIAGPINASTSWFYAYRTLGVLSSAIQIGATQTELATSGFVDSTARTLDVTLSLFAGDEIYLWGQINLVGSASVTYYPDYDSDAGAPFVPVYTEFSVTADTTYPTTTTDAFLLLNAAKNIVSKLVGQSSVVTSSYLSACGEDYALARGLHIRGYSFADKPFSMTFDDWWRGANPILNLGLGYINGADQIEIEQKSEFYDYVPVLNLDYVNNIERNYEQDFIFKSVEVGYEKWAAESGSGIDDPQTKRVFRTRFKTVGSDSKILSKFYAASLGIEQTRRNRVELGRDWRLDEDIMIIALKKTDNTLPEFNELFTSVSGLLNSDARYNIRLSASRIMKRWHVFLNGCLKWYTTNDDFVFASGEGNFDMISTLSASDCEGDGIAFDEGADIDAGAGHDFLFVPIQYEFEHPLTWDEYKAIRDYRKKAIGVSRSNTGHVSCFIVNLEYHVTSGLGKFTVLLGQTEPL